MKSILLNKQSDLGLLILRLIVGGAMLLHGMHKLLNGIPGIISVVEAHSLPTFFAYGVYVGEVVAPLLLLLGFRTRLAALVFAFNCVVAILLVHANQIFTINPETGGWAIELLGLYFFGALALFFTGGGKYAVSTKSMWD